MNLYKYVSSEDAVKNIIDGKIKFATLESLNDPTELLPRIYEDELLKSLEDKRKNGYNHEDLEDLNNQERLFGKLSPETMVISAPKSIEQANSIVKLSVYDNVDYLKKMFDKTVELMSSRCGIFCISTRNNSLPMWAHYANNASGFVIEFEDLENEFLGDGTGILNQIKDVDYKLVRSGVTFERGSYHSVFFEKDKDWGYESEKRIVVDLASCTTLQFENGKLFIKEIDKRRISKVIFGWKVTGKKIEKLSKEIKEINPNIETVAATIKNGFIEIKSL
ncbi:Protein of unknown function [Reichenbachiella faecimaris]|uniref:DUF2971 domain-containing protein n=1 Tax=Reichenbachiella faecimaris TaxID=692418 RepID=A0A1W2G573_REIFA|nr:DUF2971 domain-containing protein [Reichenbachiella faecimaris]SMD31753.1 Protein of unknown function [Reichenbachiella faecimaris]